ncbi:MAG: GNAT family N-acetyltransferase [Ferrimicrobium sp.]|jgi:GNAT superfamily N-acetyltransferase|nr:GNAT family N-acetyltransferase [Ferrimicrobium sp.]
MLVGLSSPADGVLLSIDPALTRRFIDGYNSAPTQGVVTNTRLGMRSQSPSHKPCTSTPLPPEAETVIDDVIALNDAIAFIETRLGLGDHAIFCGFFRFAFSVPDLGEPGIWVSASDPGIPAWLHSFGTKVLVAYDDDHNVIAGVGLKRHDSFARELAVVTEPQARGRGLAKALVAQAARQVLRDGMIPTYLHAPDNQASAKVAEATGFIDRGWRILGLTQESQTLLEQEQ